MNETTEILDYVIHWKFKSESGFVGELFHIVRNKSGGGLSTPIGNIIGFIEPASEYLSSYWKILITAREEVRYDIYSNTTYVFVKSAYASKLEYLVQKLMELTKDVIRINPKLPAAIQEELIKSELCSSPLAIEMIIGSNKYVYSNVEFSLD